MRDSFEFALFSCGYDKDAGSIWCDYIAFVKGCDENLTVHAYAEKRKQLLNIYRRALAIPLENLEQLWKDYRQFEILDNREVPPFLHT